MLQIEKLTVSAGNQLILKDVSLRVERGQVMVLFGPNGSGKTTLLKTVMGFPGYRVESGRILFKGCDLANLTADARCRMGIGISFQTPPVVRGVKLMDLLRSMPGAGKPISEERIFQEANGLNLAEFLFRELNLGFSGGEVKRSELLQLLIQGPDFTLFDEPDSGVDLDNIRLVGSAMERLLGRHTVREGRSKGGLIITHQGHILDYINADSACIMLGGTIACCGNPRDILREIRENGYEECVRCQSGRRSLK